MKLLQPSCLLCGSHPHDQHNLCNPCRKDLPWCNNTCDRCGEKLGDAQLSEISICYQCLIQPPLYSKTIAAFDYEVPVNTLINQFKHEHKLAVGSLLSACLCEKVLNTVSSIENVTPQLLVPVPLSVARLRHRGFNQAQFIATQLSQHLKIAMDTRLCRRIGDQTRQQGKNRNIRVSQVQDVFSVSVKKRHKEVTSIAIIDDVMTTGSTAKAMSKAIKLAWGEPLNIQIWCLARAQPKY